MTLPLVRISSTFKLPSPRIPSTRSRFCVATALTCFFLAVPHVTSADEPVPGDAVVTRYSDAVVAKAESILAEAGLRRSGKMITVTDTGDVARALGGLSKDRRALQKVQQDWQLVVSQLDAIRKQLEQLNSQDGKLSFQLATLPGNDVATNNRYVGMINATRAQMRELTCQRDRLKESELTEKRNALNQAEADYANLVIAIRRSYRELHESVSKRLTEEPVKIALRVMHANFDTPAEVTADSVLVSLNKRIEKIEQEIFSENITLDVDGGSLYVTVSVGNKTARMVVDSGATLVSLPATTAEQLGIQVPADARKMKLTMADGRTIDARAVTLERVRVGEFEAENVEAAILDAAAIGAEPLLGMSYLSNFKFEIDSAAKSLKMLRVGSDDE